jgi:glutamate carboxypeptidase
MESFMRNEIKNPRLNDLIGLLAEITNINSGSGNIEGVNEVQNIVARECKALGLEVTLLDHPQGSHLSGKLLIATHKKNNGPYINLVTHADTVFDQIQ